MNLLIDLVPPIEFAPPTLISATLAQRGSGGESPSVDVTLDPGRGEVAARLDPPPLRAYAVLTYDDGSTFAGVVQSVRLGADCSITLEA